MASTYSCDFEVHQTKIKGGCQTGKKVVPHDYKSDLPLRFFSKIYHYAFFHLPVNLGDPESTAKISNVIFSVCSLSSFVLT